MTVNYLIKAPFIRLKRSKKIDKNILIFKYFFIKYLFVIKKRTTSFVNDSQIISTLVTNMIYSSELKLSFLYLNICCIKKNLDNNCKSL